MAKIIPWIITAKRDYRGLAELYPGRAHVFSWGYPNSDDPFIDFNPSGIGIPQFCAAKAAIQAECSKVLYGTQSFAEAGYGHLFRRNGVYDGSGRFPTLLEFHEYLCGLKVRFGREAEYVISLKTRVGAMVSALGKSLDFRGLDLRDTMDTATVFELSPMLNVEIVRYITYSIAYWPLLYRSALPFSQISQMGRLVLVVDDASQLVDAALEREGHFGTLHRVITLGREFGLSAVFASQLPERIASSIFDLHGTTISFRLPGEASRRKIGEVL